MKIVFKNVAPDPILYLEPGVQFVNNGEPIHGTYCLIDTNYKKSYLKTVRDLPANIMKTQLAYNQMMKFPKHFSLYKCLDRACTKVFSDKTLFTLHMKLHYSNLEKKKSNYLNIFFI